MRIFSNIEEKRFEKWSNIKNCADGQVILVDRSFITILAVQYAVMPYKTNNTMDELEKYWLNLPQIIVPDEIVILDVSNVQQLQRVKNARGKYLPIFLEKEFNSRFISYLKDFCKKTNIRNIYIDTTNLSLDQVNNMVLEKTGLLK